MNYSQEKNLHDIINGILRQSRDNQVQLNEALELKAHKLMATKAANSSKDDSGLTAAERISKDVMPSDRIVIPLERFSKPDREVVDHLSRNGYRIHDYQSGLAYHVDKPERKERIGRILAKTGATLGTMAKFEKDPSRQGLKTDAHIVISRRPYDVASGSECQNWKSCTTLGGTYPNILDKDGNPTKVEKGAYSEMVPGIVASGAHVAYLVKHPDDVDKHFGPIARITLNPYHDWTSTAKPILRPSEEYGEEWSGFKESVHKWAKDNFPATSAEYKRHSDAYPEGELSIRNYTPEHDDYWMRNMDRDTMRNHPNGDFLHKAITNLRQDFHEQKRMSIPVLYKSALENHNLKPETESMIVNHANDSGRIDDVANLAGKVKNPENIQKFLERAKGAAHYRSAMEITKNGNTTHEQLHDILDTFCAGQTSVHGIRRLAHQGWSPTILDKIANHPNADESHFHKMFELEDFRGSRSAPEIEADHGHWIESVARRYKDESIGKKIMDAGASKLGFPSFHSLKTVAYVAQKHPHLLDAVSETDLKHSSVSAMGNEKLSKYILQKHSHNPEMVRAAIVNLNENDVKPFLEHPDPWVRLTAQVRQKFFETQKGMSSSS